MPECPPVDSLEVEEESARFLIPARRPVRRLRPWHGVLLGVSAAALLAVAATAARRTRTEVTPVQSRAEDLSQAYAAKFEQCSGNGVRKKCQPGCFCAWKSDFFSMCKPVNGLDVCSAAAAKANAKKAYAKLKPLAKKVDAMADAKDDAHKHFTETLRVAGETKDAAAHASSMKAVTGEAATMDSVKSWHKDNIKKAAGSVDDAKDNEEKAKKRAEVQANKAVEEAEEKVRQAKADLEKVKEESKVKVKKMITSERRKVEDAQDNLKEVKATPLNPELDDRKTKAAAASKKAQETAVAAKKAAEAFIKAKKAKEEADRAAAKAVDNAKDAKKNYANAKQALG